MSTITTKDGVEIFYKDWGQGQPIVFSHGWPLSADDWDTQMLFFLGKGFRVWPAGWHDIAAAEMLMDYSLAQKSPRMIGYLSTTWGRAKLDELESFPPTKLAVTRFPPAK